MNSEDIGYLKRAVEDLTKLISDHMEKEERDRAEDRQTFCNMVEGLNKRLSKIEDDVSVAKTAIKFAKVGLGVIVCILTLKFGDIPQIWRDYFPKP